MTHLPLTSKPRSFLLEEEEENGNGLAEWPKWPPETCVGPNCFLFPRKDNENFQKVETVKTPILLSS
jgi:hypothetical protein